jgi:hypothetical protein
MSKSSIIEMLKNYSFYKSRRVLLEKELNKKKEMDNACMANDPDSGNELKSELSLLEYKIDTVETCLKLTGEYNERYKIIVESHYFYNVRIEDIADMTHMSRSRCYELCNEAVAYMTRIICGKVS